MTGADVFKRALCLLNYTDENGEPDPVSAAELYKRGLALTDQIAADLCRVEGGTYAPLRSPDQPLPLSDRAARQVLPYGVAMLLAAGRGDEDNRQLFAALYAQSRLTLTRREHRTDILPRGCDA